MVPSTQAVPDGVGLVMRSDVMRTWSQDLEVTEKNTLREGAGQHPQGRNLQGHHRHEERPEHKDRASSKRNRGRCGGRDLRPAGHPHGDHPTGFLARDNRAGMEHGPRGQLGRGGSGRRRREPEGSLFESTKRGNRRVTEPNRGGVLSQEAAPTFCRFCCLASAFLVFRDLPLRPPSCLVTDWWKRILRTSHSEFSEVRVAMTLHALLIFYREFTPV